MAELDPQIVAEMLASGFTPPQPLPKRSVRSFNTLSERKTPDASTPVSDFMFGNPEGSFPAQVDKHGRPLFSIPLEEFRQTHPGQTHPEIEAGLMGGALASGAPEAIARTLLGPVGRGAQKLIQQAPYTTAGVGGAAASTIPSGTGKTPWEVMNEQWESRRGGLKEKIAAEKAIIEGQANKPMTAADEAALAKARADFTAAKAKVDVYKKQGRTDNAAIREEFRMNSAQQIIDSFTPTAASVALRQQQAEPITGPAQTRISDFEKQLAGIDEEIKQSQTPIRQSNPLLGQALMPLAWAGAGGLGYKVGKMFRGAQENKAESMADLIARAEGHIANTTLKTGKPGTLQFKSPEGKGIAEGLTTAEKQGNMPAWLQAALPATTGAAVGAAEGTLVPGGFSAWDAMSMPAGSPGQKAASEGPLTSAWWQQAAPEMGMTGLMGAILAGTGAMKGKSGLGPVAMPTGRVGELAASARAAQTAAPKAASKAKKGKAAPVVGVGLVGGAALDNVPDL